MTAARSGQSRFPEVAGGAPAIEDHRQPSMGPFSHLGFCAMAGTEIGRLAEIVRGADLARRVPWSRRWRLEDLVHHVGAVHRWATDLVASDARRYRPIRDTDDWPGAPTAPEAARWLAAGRDPLLHALQAADPDHKMWAWGADKHVRFWSRRMTHETCIHRADAELALGLEPQFQPGVAADGVGEFLANLWSARAWRRDMGALRGGGETIALTASDTGDQWRIERTPEGFRWTHDRGARPEPSDVSVSGSARDLYLLVWKRIRPGAEGLKVTGDIATLDHWRRYSSV